LSTLPPSNVTEPPDAALICPSLTMAPLRAADVPKENRSPSLPVRSS
jgi:hypothetical protein